MIKKHIIFTLIIGCTVIYSSCRKEEEIPGEVETIVFEEHFSEKGNWVLTADTFCTANILDSSLVLQAFTDNYNYTSEKANAFIQLNPFPNSDKLIIRIKFIKYWLFKSDGETAPHNFSIGIGTHEIKAKAGGYSDFAQSVHWTNDVLEIFIDKKAESLLATGGVANSKTDIQNFFYLSPNIDSTFFISFTTNIFKDWSISSSSDGYAEIESIIISTVD